MGKIKGWDKISEGHWQNFDYKNNGVESKIEIVRTYSRIRKESYYSVQLWQKRFNEPWPHSGGKEIAKSMTYEGAKKSAVQYMRRHPNG